MRATHLSIALLCFGVIAIGATTYLGSPWPGVALIGLSLVPWGWDAWLGRGGMDSKAKIATLDGQSKFMSEAIISLGAQLKEANATADDQQQQISSLRNAVSLRGTFGG